MSDDLDARIAAMQKKYPPPPVEEPVFLNGAPEAPNEFRAYPTGRTRTVRLPRFNLSVETFTQYEYARLISDYDMNGNAFWIREWIDAPDFKGEAPMKGLCEECGLPMPRCNIIAQVVWRIARRRMAPVKIVSREIRPILEQRYRDRAALRDAKERKE